MSKVGARKKEGVKSKNSWKPGKRERLAFVEACGTSLPKDPGTYAFLQRGSPRRAEQAIFVSTMKWVRRAKAIESHRVLREGKLRFPYALELF